MPLGGVGLSGRVDAGFYALRCIEEIACKIGKTVLGGAVREEAGRGSASRGLLGLSGRGHAGYKIAVTNVRFPRRCDSPTRNIRMVACS